MAGRGAKAYAATQTDDPANREENDFYPTPPSAVEALLTVERFRRKIWEPACGTGDMVRPLQAAGHLVIATDLVDRGFGYCGDHWNFLERRDPEPEADIISNPPFKLAQAFIQHALNLTRPRLWEVGGKPVGTAPKVAMFMRLAFLEGRERAPWFPTTPLARVYVMSARVKIQRGRLAVSSDKGGTMAFAWYVWQHGHQGPPSLHFLDWKIAEARKMRGT